MDRYLEQRWRGVHVSLIVYASDAIQPQLPDLLIARIEANEYPDATGGDPGIDRDPLTERHIEIVEGDGGPVVTAIEILSPWNKVAGPGRERYLRKREQYLAGKARLVEIDLVRAGRSWSMVAPDHLWSDNRSPYRVTVKRSTDRKLEVYPISLKQKLPVIPIPLRKGEPDVTLDLQTLIEKIYRNGRYERTDYSKPCDPPLDGQDEIWADELLKSAGRR